MQLKLKMTRGDRSTVELDSPSTALDRSEMRNHIAEQLEARNWDWAPGDTLQLELNR